MCWRFIERFPSSPSAPSRARTAVTDRFGAETQLQVGAETVDDVRLVVSELATNAVHASADDFVLVIEIHHGEARVEVSDTSQALPHVEDPSSTQAHGRGLLLVAGVATDWGVDSRAVGKAVWATLSLPDHATERIVCGLPNPSLTRPAR
jgi:anti-sigma regulatory factor (Ser/Thr protein kinase)